MENNCIAIHHVRAKGEDIDYWLTIDSVDSELSGLPLKYRNHDDVSSALGVDTQMIRSVLFRLRHSAKLATRRASITQ